MSNDQALVQVNIKSGEGFDATLVNVYAKTPEELVQLLNAVTEHAPLIAEARGAVALAHGIEVKKGSVQQVNDAPAQAVAQQGGWAQPQQGSPSWAAPATPAPGAGPACKHGPREYKAGTSKAGKAYKMWACTSGNRQDQCDPEWVRW